MTESIVKQIHLLIQALSDKKKSTVVNAQSRLRQLNYIAIPYLLDEWKKNHTNTPKHKSMRFKILETFCHMWDKATLVLPILLLELENEISISKQFEMACLLLQIEGLDGQAMKKLDFFENSKLLPDGQLLRFWGIKQNYTKNKAIAHFQLTIYDYEPTKELLDTIKSEVVEIELSKKEINDVLQKIDKMNVSHKIITLKKIGERGPENRNAGEKIKQLLLEDPDENVRLESGRTLAKISFPVEQSIWDNVLSDPKNNQIKMDLLVAAKGSVDIAQPISSEKKSKKKENKGELLFNGEKVFISYTIEDIELASNLYDRLKKLGLRPWMASKDIVIGMNWQEAIENQLLDSEFVIVCISSNFLKKDSYIQKELKIAYNNYLKKPKDTIYLIPLLIEPGIMKDYLKITEFSEIQVSKYYETDGFKKLIQSIAHQLKVEIKDLIESEIKVQIKESIDTQEVVDTPKEIMSIGILTAIKDEAKAINQYFNLDDEVDQDGRPCHIGTIKRDEGLLKIIHYYAQKGPDSKDYANFLIDNWQPDLVFVVGILGGIAQNNVKIGDIIISDSIILYEYGTYKEGKFHCKPEHVPVDYNLIDHFRNLNISKNKHKWFTTKKEIKVNNDQRKLLDLKKGDNLKPEIHIGTYFCGEKVIRDKKFAKALLELENETKRKYCFGCDMESGYVMKTSLRKLKDKRAIVIKCVSDLIDEPNEDLWDKFHELASYRATKFLLYFLVNGTLVRT
ncbi:MAG: TIR domain-containing protein [Candidatus Heimdallarchaeota archaeon]|nr:TIR domain-containing protein [Candidatus Heimdallarchaeota archaeon]